ncbi:hypothetical protein OR16_07806 [Cupriavidus basilensis OR16]|uniref:Uncharacterized protein n=1 Tax=Cupriavidus basilensis OR16 TaxID=1127483 RepID=H1S1M0_9BURK|nr:hypothetical protein [Cupriavidus basilensis]EHP43595.1 hypothetical protein OR16_07806 [Cupriavidus basilensis OR16]
MKDTDDKVTAELVDLPKRGRGRPSTGQAMTAAERKAAQRARAGLVPVTVELPVELVDALNDYLRYKDMTKNEVFAKLLRTQLLRKR